MKVYPTSRFLKAFLFLLNLSKFRDVKKFFRWLVLKGQLFYPILCSSRILFLKVCITSKTVFLVLCNPKIVTQSCLILCDPMNCISSVQFSSVSQLCPTLCDPMNCSMPSPTPGVHPDSRPSSQWCHPAISSSVVPFSSCPQSLPASVFSNESTLHMR